MLNRLTEEFNSGSRGPEWAAKCCDKIIESSNVGFSNRTRESLCYDMFYADPGTNSFDYLTGEGEMKYPSKVRFIPIVRPLFEVLRSTEAVRPWEPRVFSIDEISTQKKEDIVYRDAANRVIQRLVSQNQRIEMVNMQIQMQRQYMQQAAQQQQEQGGAVDPMMQFHLARIEQQLKAIEDMATRSQEVIVEELEKANKYYKYSFQTALEKALSIGLRWWAKNYNMEEVFLDGFTDLFVVDQEIYYVAPIVEGEDPQVQKISPMDYYYPAQNGVRYVDELDWGLGVYLKTVSQIVQEYPELTNEQIQHIKKCAGTGGIGLPIGRGRGYHHGYYTTAGATNFADRDFFEESYNGSTGDDLVPVYHAVWRVWDKLSEKELLEAGVYGDLVVDDEHEGEKVYKDRYVSYVWECTRIGTDVYVRRRQCPFQFRDREAIGFSYLPYVGFAYNGVERRPYSFVWATKDIQELYNVVHYQLEMMIAMSGMKGFIMDEYQLPEGLSREEWLYYVKQGIAFIESVKKTGRPAHFNQFSTFDMSIGPGVQILIGLLERFEYLVGRMIGVPPQRMGEVTKQDQVATHRSAIAQSTLTTEMLFYKHRTLIGRVMDRVIDVATIGWKHGRRGQYVSGDLGQEIFNINPGEIEQGAYKVFFSDTSRENRIMESVTQMAGAQFNAGNISISQMVEIFNAGSLREMESSLARMEELAMKKMQAAEEGRALSEQEKEKARQEFEIQQKQVLDAADRVKAQIAQLDAQTQLRDAQLRTKAQLEVAKMGNQTTLQVQDSKSQIEFAKLSEEVRSNKVEERLRAIELALSGQKVATGSSQ